MVLTSYMPTKAKLGMKLQQHTVQIVICIKVIKLHQLGMVFCLEIKSMTKIIVGSSWHKCD